MVISKLEEETASSKQETERAAEARIRFYRNLSMPVLSGSFYAHYFYTHILLLGVFERSTRLN